MPAYCFGTQPDEHGRRDLHTSTCILVPRQPRRLFKLGDHPTCESAVASAHRMGVDVNRCHFCCSPALPAGTAAARRRSWPALRVA